MHFDETREAYLAEFDRVAADIREDLADPKFTRNRWDRDGFPFVDLADLATGVASLNGLQNNTENAADVLPIVVEDVTFLTRAEFPIDTAESPPAADPIEAAPVAPEAVAVDAAPPAGPLTLTPVRRFPENHYRDTWRNAHEGIRTDWILISEESRESWRKGVDEAAASQST